VVYYLSLLDTIPHCDAAQEYHTVVWICPEYDWSQTSHDEGHLYFIEYAANPEDGICSSATLSTPQASLQTSFSVSWRPNTDTKGNYCLIPLKLNTTKAIRDVTLKLYTSIEMIRVIDTEVSHAEAYHESFALVKLFKEGNAQLARQGEIDELEQQMRRLDLAIAQMGVKTDEARLKEIHINQALGDGNEAENRTSPMGKPSNTDLICMKVETRWDLLASLSALRTRLSSVRPVQVFRPVVATHGDRKPFHIPSQRIKYSMASLKQDSVMLEDREVRSSSQKASRKQNLYTVAKANSQDLVKRPTRLAKFGPSTGKSQSIR
jgi:hypothetical protein